MDKQELFKILLATFLDELDEHVESLNRDLLLIERSDFSEGRETVVARAFRAAHSLKGAARAVTQHDIESLCHNLEAVLSGIRGETLELREEHFSTMLLAVDAISKCGVALRGSSPVDAEQLDGLGQKLAAIAAGEPMPADRVSQPTGATDSSGSASSRSDNPVAVTPPEETTASAAEQTLVDDDSSEEATDPNAVTVKTASESRTVGASIRVSEEKIDAVLAESSELLVARQRIGQRPKDVELLASGVTRWRREWLASQRALRRYVRATSGNAPTDEANEALNLLQRNQEELQQLQTQLDELVQALTHDARHLDHVGNSLQEQIHQVRMVRFIDGCSTLERTVRDVAVASGKSVNLQIDGGDIELDRTVLQGLRDPLLHLVRNAVDHGLESDAVRLESNKSLPATVNVSAVLRGTQIDVSVADDGQGLQLDRIKKRLAERGMPVPSDRYAIVQQIFHPGFSTREVATDISGRGVGLDVVKSRLEELHGTISVISEPGLGTRFTMTVPLTLSTIRGLLLRVGHRPFVLPNTNVVRVIRFAPDELQTLNGRDVLSIGRATARADGVHADGMRENSPHESTERSAPLPVVRLGDLLGLPTADSKTSKSGEHLLGVLVAATENRLILVVDEISAEQELVIKGMGRRVRHLPCASGVSILPTGELAVLLNAAGLIRQSAGTRVASVRRETAHKKPEAQAIRVLVVDDSVTTRTLLKSILESAGYDVTAAVDGADAWKRFASHEFDLVISDVDMPNMDGFQLTSRIREQSEIPVVLVTSRDSEEDKARGVECGANSYIVKQAFEQTSILQTVEQLV